ncbi:(deoxy)nucleoside triphosphate pyrophosphohydrolase [Alkalihalobacillus sp. MEB130]|uniref:(deoxy)nucleoside triphosphate pyrophosphohydrolase n=1 Tax=Alkalihalobacillus sp. MEB130 TaxID=2976704 RepID=UPI0028DDFA05|nr:(deoxy)nucleoside triphosphate pyrophosphohydrolase [Alkalihalobacillus sp. MEB130]MDT8861375.1 (deoxy)nucleoside triphosphate pyrophosphohydrolase [Alkalihalobacillus sp. MEB130]
MNKTINVVAAIIENEKLEILCALRSPVMKIPNMWEFPGGKVEKDEDCYSALKREITEELQCQIEPIDVFHEHTHTYEEFTIHLIVIRAKLIAGLPIANEHSKLLWLKREQLLSLQWAPADIPAVQKLIRKKEDI